MSPATPGRMQLWTDLPAAGGLFLCEIRAVIDGMVDRSQDGMHSLTLILDANSTEGELARKFYAIVVDLPNGLMFDYVISNVDRDLGPQVGIVADPAEVILRDIGPIYTHTPPNLPDYAVGWSGETTEEAFTRILIPYLHNVRGMTWITLGDFDSVVKVSGGGEMVSAGQFIGAFESDPDSGGTGCQLVFEKIGQTAYKIHMLRDPGSDQDTAWITDLKILDIAISEDREDQATVIIPRGGDVEGRRAVPGDGVWKVTGVEVVYL